MLVPRCAAQRVTFLEGAAGVLALQAVLQGAMGNPAGAAQAQQVRRGEANAAAGQAGAGRTGRGPKW